LVDLDRKHSKVHKTVQIMPMSITELIWQMRKMNPGSGISFMWVFSIDANRVSNGLGHRWQFLWLPLDVNSL
jgi:hypothetical protein